MRAIRGGARDWAYTWCHKHEGGTVKNLGIPTYRFRSRIRGSSPSIDCGFDARRTSHPVAVLRAAGTTIPHSRGHRAREGGSTLYGGISPPLFATVRPPGSNGLIRPRGTRDNDPAFPGGSVWLHDSTRRDLAIVDISREGDEQFAGERDNRDAAGP